MQEITGKWNTVGVNYAKGLELGLKWKPENTKLGIKFDYLLRII